MLIQLTVLKFSVYVSVILTETGMSEITMTDSWQCDKCERNFGSIKNRKRLKLEQKTALGQCEYMDYADLCSDCELIVKKNLRNGRWNHDN
ncbi:MAG TPA: hypothetical protein VKA95_15395 [Nitrososphaeraceae archaeon]|jgi:hypothetical protein|nr:hypothetical protein [Nitrososphaeraceae archaeon]